ncbi:MAG: PIN domain-containing protein [Nitrospira sp.]|nr:PIN domain-containing protein [bacterium]MBL7048476.1 PIN domain-containing protein [Nitrospira sp.]
MDKVLIDTSVWIEFFKKREPFFETVQKLIEEDNVCCLGVIYAELLQGAKSDKELNTIKEFIHVFNFIPESTTLWETAGLLSNALIQKGKTPGLADCFIASSAISYGAALFTLDKHFATIQNSTDLSLFIP